MSADPQNPHDPENPPASPDAAAHGVPGEAPKVKFSLWQRIVNKGATFLVISVLFHLVLLIGATLYVVQTIQAKEKLKFTQKLAGGPPGQKNLEYKVQNAKRNQTMSAPMAANTRITSTSTNAKVAIPDAPTMSTSTSALPSMMGGMGGTGFGASGGGRGGGSGGGGGGMGGAMAALPATGFTVFGFKGGGSGRGFIGELYDLKQFTDRKPTEHDSSGRGSVMGFLKNFSDKKFDPKLLTPYFKSPVQLMAQRFWVPSRNAGEIPQVFGVEKDVKPAAMVLLYRAKVAPPKDGVYRFVGFGDDFLGIKFNGKVIMKFDDKGSRKYCKGEEAGAFYEITKGGHMVSDPVRLSANQPCEMEVVLAEGPGGLCGFSLLVEREEDRDRYKKTPDGLLVLPIFETDTNTPLSQYTGIPGKPTILPPNDPNRVAWKVLKD
ncbi:MAG: hypothetical protein RLZZ244_2568 [Verrucomicrobiota bacterium]